MERFIDGLGHTQASGSSSAKVSKDRENSYYPAKRNYIHSSNRNDAKVALLADIVEALPPDDMIRALYDCFVTRCQAPLGNVVHTPTFKRQAEKLCNDLSRVPYDEKYEVLDDGFPLDALACLLLAVRDCVLTPRAYDLLT